MNHKPFADVSLPAPCLVNNGTVIHKADMVRLLQDVGQVFYQHRQDGLLVSEGRGFVMDVFADSQQATLVANRTLYINVHSFDCLELSQDDSGKACFDLVQDACRLRLMPLSDPMQDQVCQTINAAAFEAMVTEALAAGWDACLDDEGNYSDGTP